MHYPNWTSSQSAHRLHSSHKSAISFSRHMSQHAWLCRWHATAERTTDIPSYMLSFFLFRATPAHDTNPGKKDPIGQPKKRSTHMKKGNATYWKNKWGPVLRARCNFDPDAAAVASSLAAETQFWLLMWISVLFGECGPWPFVVKQIHTDFHMFHVFPFR